MDLQLHPKVLAAPPKNLNTDNTEIAWFWIKDCSDKRGKQIKFRDTSEIEALSTKKPYAKFQRGVGGKLPASGEQNEVKKSQIHKGLVERRPRRVRRRKKLMFTRCGSRSDMP
ncbi:hypothetical protein GGX14DRAFT_402281 [Mycena pura]|uniref:Uncharacterized protein n=1 Tax=Mycena pura TaxID=153505 RepID=A0AAD6V5R0_9AGAR|nr:hypothetical protein GGX14DRAFT_402281 [Mycena pura]